MDITHITSLLGGVALFLYGMSIMGAGLEKLAGGKMQGVLQKLTSSTIKGVIFGTLITGVIQSSAGTVVICVGLVNSGIMTLTQSVGVIMGANIGTTVTGAAGTADQPCHRAGQPRRRSYFPAAAGRTGRQAVLAV